jgi:thioredoxin
MDSSQGSNYYTIAATVLAGAALFAFVALRPGSDRTTSGPSQVLSPKTSAEFVALTSGADAKPAVVKFHAKWCGPCRVYAPIFDRASANKPEGVRFLSVDVDNLGEIARKYGINPIPCTIAIDSKGKEIARQVGVMGETQILQMANAAKQ